MTSVPVKIHKKRIDGKQIRLSVLKEKLPLIVLIAAQNIDTLILQDALNAGSLPFNLLSISDLRWDEELSPWPEPPIVDSQDHFTGEADQLIRQLEEDIIPWALSKLQDHPEKMIIGGYSMGGLFSVYAPYKTVLFDQIICVSGSLWYPDFCSWAMAHQYLRKPESIYYSLGTQETSVRNPYLQKTGEVMEELSLHDQHQGIETVFEWNQGNHFHQPIQRIVKGIIWTLKAKRGQKDEL